MEWRILVAHPREFNVNLFFAITSEGEKPPKIRKGKVPRNKVPGNFISSPTEKKEKIGKIKGTLVRKVPGNLRSQEFVFFLVRFFCPLLTATSQPINRQLADN